jgi:hypothetical protein
MVAPSETWARFFKEVRKTIFYIWGKGLLISVENLDNTLN